MILTPESTSQSLHNKSIFLAGAIDLGKAVDWQSELAPLLSKNGWIVFNPRKETWIEEKISLVRQIKWELERIQAANYILFYLPATSTAPISLLELGLVLGLGKPVIVCCEPDYYRYTNVVLTFNSYTHHRNRALFLTSFDDLKALCEAPQWDEIWDF